MEIVFIQLAMILFMAFIVSYIARAFNQPIIIGYIIAGIAIALIIEFGFVQIDASKEIIDIFSQFGIAFLLFIVGLHLNPRVIKEIGLSSLLVGVGHQHRQGDNKRARDYGGPQGERGEVQDPR